MAYENIDFSIFKTPTREFMAGVTFRDRSTGKEVFSCNTRNNPNDPLKSITIERTIPEGKLFGFVCIQKMTIEMIGRHTLAKGLSVESFIGIYGHTTKYQPYFFVEECSYNVAENKTVVVAYDALYKLKSLRFGSLGFGDTKGQDYDAINIPDMIIRLCQMAGAGAPTISLTHLDEFEYKRQDVNLELTASALEALTAACEALGVICYIHYQHKAAVKQIDFKNAVDTITRADYFEFAVGTPKVMTQVAHTTELADNVVARDDHTYNYETFCQTLRENPLFTLKSDAISSALGTTRNNLCGYPVYPYNIKWRGCPYYHPGDILNVETEPGVYVPIIYGNDTITYNGGMVSQMGWAFGETMDEPIETANTVGGILKETYARVDKLNNEISLVAGDVSSLKVNMDGIYAEVTDLGKDINGLQGDVADIIYHSKVGITAKEASLLFEERLKDGLTTSMGYSFNNDGMKISRSTSDITTQITEDGMKVYIGDETVLTANNHGVEAKNLEASTYLIISGKCYFEYQEDIDRMVCFWI